MKRLGAAPSETVELIEKLVSEGLLSDARFTRAYILDQALKGKGPAVIRMKLLQKGVKTELAEIRGILSLQGFDSEEDEALKILERRTRRHSPGELKDFKLKMKWTQFLARRGFSSDAIQRAWKRLLAE